MRFDRAPQVAAFALFLGCSVPWWLRDSADPPEGVCEPGFVPRGTGCYPVAVGVRGPVDAGSWAD